jgi:hypothetical protein
MKFKLSINSSALEEILLAKLNVVGTTDDEIVDFSQSLLSQNFLMQM